MKTANGSRLLRVAFTEGRHGELEPCGCSFRPLGGVAREFNQLALWKKESDPPLLSLAAGTTFWPSLTFQAPPSKLATQLKAQYVVDALNLLGLKVLSPGADDFLLDRATLRELQKRSKFQWTSANLIVEGQTFFPPFWEGVVGGVPVVVVGIASPGEWPIAGQANVEVSPPLPALRGALRQANPQGKLVVVIGTLDEKSHAQLKREFPEVNLILGGQEGQETFAVDQIGRALLYQNPSDRARAVAKLELEVPASFTNFYSGEVTQSFFDAIAGWRLELQTVEAALPGARRAEGRRLRSERARLAQAIASAREVPIDPRSDSVIYSGMVYALAPELEQPENALSKLVARYHDSLRQIAIEEN